MSESDSSPSKQAVFQPWYDRLVAAFDPLAGQWEGIVAAQQGLARLRALNLEMLTNLFHPGAWLLDVGCGTGAEAIALAKLGCRVFAIDISPAMIEEATRQAKAAGVADRIQFRVLPAGRLDKLLEDIPEQRLDGGWSTWGTIHLEPDVEGLKRGLAGLLHPSARWAMGGLAPRSVFDLLYRSVHGQPGTAFKRLRGTGWYELSGYQGLGSLEIEFQTAQTLADRFKPELSVDRVFNLTTFTPSQSLALAWNRHPGLYRMLERIEKGSRQSPTLLGYSDQYLLVMRRNAEGLSGPFGPDLLANG